MLDIEVDDYVDSDGARGSRLQHDGPGLYNHVRHDDEEDEHEQEEQIQNHAVLRAHNDLDLGHQPEVEELRQQQGERKVEKEMEKEGQRVLLVAKTGTDQQHDQHHDQRDVEEVAAVDNTTKSPRASLPTIFPTTLSYGLTN